LSSSWTSCTISFAEQRPILGSSRWAARARISSHRAHVDFVLQADGARRERELQSELDRLAGSKTTAVATKKSKQEPIVRQIHVVRPASDADVFQGKLNDKIRAAESTFDTVSSLDAEIEMLEANIARTEEQQAQLEAEIRELRFDEKIREKAVEIRQKEAERDKISAELSALNRQADSRAQLAIKRNEMGSKQGQVTAS
jgi:DNA repair protein RAD50